MISTRQRAPSPAPFAAGAQPFRPQELLPALLTQKETGITLCRRDAGFGEQAAQRPGERPPRKAEAIARPSRPDKQVILYCIIVGRIMKQKIIKFLWIFCLCPVCRAQPKASSVRQEGFSAVQGNAPAILFRRRGLRKKSIAPCQDLYSSGHADSTSALTHGAGHGVHLLQCEPGSACRPGGRHQRAGEQRGRQFPQSAQIPAAAAPRRVQSSLRLLRQERIILRKETGAARSMESSRAGFSVRSTGTAPCRTLLRAYASESFEASCTKGRP